MLSLHIQLESVFKPIDALNTSGKSQDSRVKCKFIIHLALSSASPSSLLKLAIMLMLMMTVRHVLSITW